MKFDKMTDVKFWIEDPCILFTDLVFFPTVEMPREQKLNALTRLALVIAIVMYSMEYKYWLTFLLIAVLLLVVIQYASKARDDAPAASPGKQRENFTIVPTYIGDDFSTTVVAPTFAEEHRIPPPAYDHYTNVDFTPSMFQEPIRPQAYPYGQYLTRTNLLPNDEYAVHMNSLGGAKSAREYVNSTFIKHDLAFRENMMRAHKKSLNRRFRHNNNDTWSPFHSY